MKTLVATLLVLAVSAAAVPAFAAPKCGSNAGRNTPTNPPPATTTTTTTGTTTTTTTTGTTTNPGPAGTGR